ncbi:MAG: N-acetylmuramoyl-L-alanine amidase [Clostridiales bacterium]|nr:N-acetylmuramoyl-L-alanine amidase [Clostridiales bacterium]
MKFRFGISLLLFVISALVLYNHYGQIAVTAIKHKTVIVIDVGHGGSDPGKVSADGIKEKDVNLQIAQYLKDYLIAQDYTIYLTRDTDKGLYDENASNKKRADLNNRIRFFKEKKAVCVVSIHQNSFPDFAQHGAQTFYFTGSKEGEALASTIQKSLLTIDSTNTRTEKSSDSYYLLKHSDVPAVIVECGFLSNPEETSRLTDPNYQKRLAYSISLGIGSYLSSADRTLSTTREKLPKK